MRGIIGYGAYVPVHRLSHASIASVLGGPAGRGARAVAAYDEDTTTMAVEALRGAVAATPGGAEAVRQLFLATAAPAYLDKTNATAVHAALRLDRSALAIDMAGSVRAGTGALLQAARSGPRTAVALADVRIGLPGGADERTGGDGAAALIFDDAAGAPVLAEVLSTASATAEFLDRWRTPDRATAQVWEERFGEQQYVPLGSDALAAALERADLKTDQVDHLIVAGLHTRALAAFGKASGVRPDATAPDLTHAIGNTGTAHPGIALADVLDRAEPGQIVAVVVLADGADALILRTTEELPRHRQARPVSAQIGGHVFEVDYGRYLSWRGLLDREPPRRPDPAPPAAPPAQRSTAWKFGFVAAECTECSTRLLPPGRACNACGAVDRMTPVPMADTPARVATYTVDRLAFVPSPPLVSAVIDFAGGGRFRCELTDITPDQVRIGLAVEMTFRNSGTARGVHNYFWKARPARETQA